jgi:hypothetical protein
MPSRRKSVNSGAAGLSIGNEDTIRHDEDLKPDPGTETDLEIEDKQVQLFTRAYEQTSEKLVGISRFWWPLGLEKELRTDHRCGLSSDEESYF